ncbi:hypothetical protein [Methylobacterium sp. Leaf91]|uniref:DUF6894 family protein n=1 Tax=Methylobacterium sp. Leaf91 TaxID=1736247 RepID=UPI0006F6117E|nr:hypothetical protein [Methylobacterium sp. Leaf91]KQO94633.1 hypothetical protein ASF32_19160 [Methylobacterium sp. Leaf91]
MARYFFDVHDGGLHQFDEQGSEFATLDEVRQQAMRLLPDVARDHAKPEGERLAFTVVVSDEDHRPVYSATLSLVGVWLIR